MSFIKTSRCKELYPWRNGSAEGKALSCSLTLGAKDCKGVCVLDIQEKTAFQQQFLITIRAAGLENVSPGGTAALIAKGRTSALQFFRRPNGIVDRFIAVTATFHTNTGSHFDGLGEPENPLVKNKKMSAWNTTARPARMTWRSHWQWFTQRSWRNFDKFVYCPACSIIDSYQLFKLFGLCCNQLWCLTWKTRHSLNEPSLRPTCSFVSDHAKSAMNLKHRLDTFWHILTHLDTIAMSKFERLPPSVGGNMAPANNPLLPCSLLLTEFTAEHRNTKNQWKVRELHQILLLNFAYLLHWPWYNINLLK